MLSYGFVEHLVDVVVGGAHGIVLNEASLGVKKYEAGDALYAERAHEGLLLVF